MNPADANDELKLPETMDHVPSTVDQAVDGDTSEMTGKSHRDIPYAEQATVECHSQFRIIRQHARGGLGRVSLAFDELLQRHVALKEIRSERANDQDAQQRFLNEAEITAQLQHPNIVPVHAIGRDAEGRPCYAMKFVEGRTLSDVIAQYFAKPSPLAMRDLLSRFVDTCHAVAYAHSEGIIHRDLKPSNVMIGEYGETMVLDWGLAKRITDIETDPAGNDEQVDAAATAEMTMEGQVLGTPGYMSPEQALGDRKRVGKASDIYSLGVILYRLLTGKNPYHDKSRSEVIRAVLTEDPMPPAQLNPQVSRALEAVCLQAMARDPQQRYESATALAKEIERWLADEPVTAYREPFVERLGRWTRQHRLSVAAAAVLLITSVVALAISNVLIQREQTRTANANVQAGKNLTLAKEKQKLAEANAKQAADNAARADRQRTLAQQRELTARQMAYATAINLAMQAWEDGTTVRAIELLERQRPESGQSDLRGFEWYFLWRIFHNEQLTLVGHTEMVNSVTFSPDGSQVASASDDDTVRIWNRSTGELLHKLETSSEVVVIDFDPTGKLLAAGMDGGEIRIFDTSSGESTAQLLGHTGSMQGLSWSPDGATLASGSAKNNQLGELILWDVATGQQRIKLADAHRKGNQGHPWGIHAVAFAPDGKTLATAGYDGFVKVFRSEDGELVGEFNPNPSAWHHDVAFHPDGTMFATCGHDMTVKIWDPATVRPTMILRPHLGRTESVAFSPDGKHLAAGTENGVIIWEVGTWRTGGVSHPGNVYGVAYSPDSQSLATAGRDTLVKVWDMRPHHLGDAINVPSGGGVTQLDTSLTDDQLIAGAYDGSIHLFNIQDRTFLKSVHPHGKRREANNPLYEVRFSPDGQQIVTRGADNSGIKVWDHGIDEPLFQVSPATHFDFRATTHALVTQAAGDDHLSFWNMSTGSSAGQFAVGRPLDAMAFFADGNRFVGVGNRLTLWDLDSGESRDVESEFLADVWAVRLAADENTFAMQSRGNRPVQIHRATDGSLIAAVRGHSKYISDFAYSRDGKTLATSSDDMTVKLWQAATGQHLLTLKGFVGSATSVRFNHDDRLLIAGGAEFTEPGRAGEIRFWQAADPERTTSGAQFRTNPGIDDLTMGEALIRGAASYQDSGNETAAQQAAQRAMHMLTDTIFDKSSSAERTLELANRIHDLAAKFPNGGLDNFAVRLNQQALEIKRGLLAGSPRDPELQSETARTLHNMAARMSGSRRLDDARTSMNEAIRLQQSAIATIPDQQVYQERLGSHLKVLASVLGKQGEYRERAEVASEWADLRADHWHDVLDAAKVMSQCADTVGNDQALEETERQKLQQQYRQTAIKQLRHSLDLNNDDLPHLKKHLVEDGEFNAIRSQKDFRALESDVDQKIAKQTP